MTPPRPEVRRDLVALEGYHSPQVAADVRLNTNESPFPPPAGFVEELAREVTRLSLHRYPDRRAWSLRCALAERYGRRPEEVFVANGSNEVLQTLLLTFGGPGRRALTFEPTYAMHGQITRTTGTQLVESERGADLRLDPDSAVEAITAVRPDLIFLCSPNNPTGLEDPPDTVNRVLGASAAGPALVILDEAYGQFAGHSAVDMVAEDVPLVVTRTFSKTWSLAGLRIGYMIGPAWLVAELDKVVLPYHLDAFKQRAAELALGHVDEMNERVSILVAERERMSAALDRLDLDVWPSGSNFLLFRPRRVRGDDVWQHLLDRGVLVRNCASWPRLEGCLRVTVGTAEENDRFLGALEDVVA